MQENSPDATRLKISFAEFVALIALMSSLIALAIDAMLPALDVTGVELQVRDTSDTQLIISSLFFGMAVSQIFYGPLSDSLGRKPVIYFGLVVFIIGSIMSALANDFSVLLFSRFLQGLGLAAPRVVSMAVVRDLFTGRAMARVNSFTMIVFILVPVFAPALGQGILLLGDWRAIFWVIAALGVVVLIWFAVRLEETLPQEQRTRLSAGHLLTTCLIVLRNRTTMRYTLISGLIFGAFLAYLSSAQHLFQGIYQTGQWFVILFGSLAVAVGAAGIYNGRRVMQLGMRYLSRRSLLWLLSAGLLFLLLISFWHGLPPIWLFMLYMAFAFFNIGILFGNVMSLAMEPLGDVAGMGAGIIGSLSTLLSVPIGVLIGRLLDTNLYPLVLGFTISAALCLLLMRGADNDE